MQRRHFAFFYIALLSWLAFGLFALSALPDTLDRPLTEYFYLWDAEIFRSIAEHGYRFELEIRDPGRNWDTNNVAYPPLYPFLARMAQALLSLSWPAALVLVANLASIAALSFLVLIAQRLRIDGPWLVVLLLVFALYPGSIWLLAGYSDALSLALAFAILHVALGVLDDPSRRRGVLLLVLGLLLGLTHFRMSVLTAGGAMIGLTWWARGLLDALSWQQKRHIALLQCLPVLGAMLAMLGFFAYCHLAFGRWDAYQQIIFGVWGPSTPDFLQILDLEIYRWFDVSLAQDRFGQSTPYLGRFLSTWMLTLSVGLLVFEVFFGTTPSAIAQRQSYSPGVWALLLSLLMQYFLITMRVPSLSNFTEYPMPSVRYLIPCALLLGLYLAQLIPEILRRKQAPDEHSGTIALSLCLLMLLGGIALQLNMFELFYQRVLQG
jgi:hypothetical protein